MLEPSFAPSRCVFESQIGLEAKLSVRINKSHPSKVIGNTSQSFHTDKICVPIAGMVSVHPLQETGIVVTAQRTLHFGSKSDYLPAIPNVRDTGMNQQVITTLVDQRLFTQPVAQFFTVFGLQYIYDRVTWVQRSNTEKYGE
jgi:hypothetical protein